MVNETLRADPAFPAFNPPIYLSAGHTAHSAEHTGIQRVTRSLARELQGSGLQTELVEWMPSRRRYVVLDDSARQKLSRQGGPVFESVDALLTRVLPQAGRLLPRTGQARSESAPANSTLSEERIVGFEAIIHSISHPIPAVPRLIGYLPVPRAMRRAIRKGVRHAINRFVRWRDRSRVRRFIREVKAIRRIHNRMTRKILKLSELECDRAFNLASMEREAWRYKQARDGQSKAQAEAAGQMTESIPIPGEVNEPILAGPPPNENEIFSLTHRLEPTRFKPIRGAWVVVPELMRPEEMRAVGRYCRRHRLNLAVVFHDAIAVTHPELVARSIRDSHADYMRHVCQADLVLAVSEQSAIDLQAFIRREKCASPRIEVCSNGASFPGERLFTDPKPPPPVRAICVGTIDPRKNHRSLIAALDLLHEDHPDLDLQVTLIGNAYAGAEDLVELVEAACRRLPGLNWLRGAEDQQLIEAYQQAHFTVFSSILEGFGIPVLESLWHGRPCICANTGAIAENAKGGGCLTVDVNNPAALAGAMRQLAGEGELRRKLTQEAQSRVLRTWREQAIDLVAELKAYPSRYSYGWNEAD